MEQPDIIPIVNLDQFAFLVASWHTNKMQQLQQALAVPDDVEIAIDLDGSGVDTPLTAEQRVAFKAGLTLAVSLFSELPFLVTQDSAPEAEVAPQVQQEPTHE